MSFLNAYEIFISEGCEYCLNSLTTEYVGTVSKSWNTCSFQIKKKHPLLPNPLPQNDFQVFEWSRHWTQQVTTRPRPQIKVNPVNSGGKSLKKTTPYSMLHNQTHLFQAGKINQDTRSQISLVGYITDLQIQIDLKLGGKTTAC